MRYPVSNGKIVPVTELGYEIVPPQRRVTNNHHMWFDRAWYQDKRYRQVFRGLLPNVVTLSISDHEDLHERYSAPIMPTDIQMIDTVEEYLTQNGVIDVVREHRTCETYQLLPEQWAKIRGGYGKTLHSS
jgi:hypothetical protein